MPTVVGTQIGLSGAFGTSPVSVTITAPASGNSLGVIVNASSGPDVTGMTCGDGTAEFLYMDADNVEYWIIRNITTSPTSISVSFAGGGSSGIDLDKIEFSGDIQQHNAQEGEATDFGSAELGPSLTSTASGVGGFGSYRTVGAVTITPSAGVSVTPTGSAQRFILYSDSLGAAGTYTFGGSCSSGVPRRVIAVLIQSAGGGGPARPVIFAGPSRRANN